ncbi:MAG: hypothetical protein WKG06_13260 [Segetibacter sp.]
MKQQQSIWKKAGKFSSASEKTFLPLNKLLFMPAVDIENKQKKKRERKAAGPL